MEPEQLSPEQSEQPKKKKRKKKKKKVTFKKVLYYGLLCLFASIFIGSAAYLGIYFYQSAQTEKLYAQMSEGIGQLIMDAVKPPKPPKPTEPETLPTDPSTGETIIPPTTEPKPTEPPKIQDFLQDTYDQNNDTIGWIYVPDTKISYPVMQTGLDRKDYYLKRNFNKRSSDWGAIYVREVCDVFKPSDNLTLYGHHMKDGSMFTGLDKYKKQSFWKDHQYIYFSNLYESHEYQVFAVFKTSANAGEGYPYHHFVNAGNQEEFDAFIAAIKSLSKASGYYDTGITPKYGDKLITLSTCEYTLENGRFVVCAVMVN